jgi:general secretion pathway protein C
MIKLAAWAQKNVPTLQRNTMNRLPLITNFVLFIALCVSAAYWAMQLFKPPARPIAAPPQTTQPEPPKLEAASALFGGHTAAVVASNFQLKGVVAASNAAESVAILSANGKPPKAVRINAEVLPGVTIKEINRGYVLLSEGGVIKRVELPATEKRK